MLNITFNLGAEREAALAEVAADRGKTVEEIVNTIVGSWAENYIEQRRAAQVESFRTAGETLAMLPEAAQERLLGLLKEEAEAAGIPLPEQEEQSGAEQ